MGRPPLRVGRPGAVEEDPQDGPVPADFPRDQPGGDISGVFQQGLDPGVAGRGVVAGALGEGGRRVDELLGDEGAELGSQGGRNVRV